MKYYKNKKYKKERGNFMKKVYFIGAGPGDPELITVKGQRIVKEADVIIYAGSLVPREVIECHKEGAEVYNSATMNLDEVREQMDILDEYGIEYEVVPGVSSFVAAAAAIKKEFTLPDVSQTIICTRLEGRTPVPETESLESLASHKCSMAIFLSVQMIDEVVKRLLKHYDKTTPIAIVQRATWDDQKIIMGTLENIAQKVKDEKITKTAQILVGNFMGDEYSKSKLYDKTFSHEFRRGIK